MHHFNSMRLIGLLAVLFSAGRVAADEPRRRALPPAVALADLQVADGLRVELAAREPQVVDPVAVRFDESGRMWVVEMGDYPHGPEPGEPPRSRIKILDDTDGDGLYEQARVFADGLLMANGLQPWRGGAIVTMAGRIVYLEDTDGDGRADKSTVWFRGFAEENSQLRANHPTLGIDGHVYIANGLRGGSAVNPRAAKAKPLSLRGMDFRFDPRTGEAELASGMGQFGLSFDDFGNRFVCSNRNPAKHIVIPNRFLQRNPLAAVAAVAHDVAAAGERSRLHPRSRAWTTSTLHAGQFTAACGVTIYRGDLLGDPLAGSVFTCDPTGNLVHCETVVRDGATFASRPLYADREFLSASDEWFRPVNLECGPDGALYVVDMCRAVIEHPQFMPAELKKRADLLWGRDAGRIYRVVPAETKIARPVASLAQQTTEALVRLLDHPNAWQRDTAARLLLERQDEAAVSVLQPLAREGKTAAGRAHALWALRGLNKLPSALVLQAMADPAPPVRQQAARLAEAWADQAEVRTALLRLGGEDSTAAVRFEAALVLAPIAAPEAPALARLAAGDIEIDAWLRRALLIAAGPHAGDVLEQLLRHGADDPVLIEELAAQAGATSDAAARQALQQLAQLPAGTAAVRGGLGLCRGLGRRRKSLPALLTTDALRQAADALVSQAARQVAAAVSDPQIDPTDQLQLLAASGSLGRSSLAEVEQLFLTPRATATRLQALQTLSRLAGVDVWAKLLDQFPQQTPAVRRALLDGALARGDRVAALLDRMESGLISASELDPIRAQRLQKLSDPALRGRARQLLAAAVSEDRQQVLQEYQSALSTLDGDAARGTAVFRQNCAACHRVGGIGVDVAPDIADSRTKQPSQILTDILQPNRAIDSNYVAYLVRTEDGQTHSGILAAETSTSITLRLPENKTVTLLRSEIARLKSSGKSLMPVGLERTIPPQAMADLISYIKNWRYLDGRTPLGPGS